MESVFITGANGFIGSNLCRFFREQGYRVYGLVRATSDTHLLDGQAVEKIYGDLRNPDGFTIPARVRHVIHAAAVVSDNATEAECRDNIYALAVNLVNKLRDQALRIERFVYISTALCLGYGATDISEEKPGRSADFIPYASYKKKTEAYLLEEFRTRGFPLVILRPGDVYGPGDRTSCALMLKGCEQGVPLIVGGGRWRFGFCYIDNLNQAVHRACITPGIAGRRYTVTNGVSPTWRDLFSGFQSALGRKQRLRVPVWAAFFVARLCSVVNKFNKKFVPPVTLYRVRRATSTTTYDISRTIKDLGYQPENDTTGQVRSIVDWYLGEKKAAVVGRSRARPPRPGPARGREKEAGP